MSLTLLLIFSISHLQFAKNSMGFSALCMVNTGLYWLSIGTVYTIIWANLQRSSAFNLSIPFLTLSFILLISSLCPVALFIDSSSNYQNAYLPWFSLICSCILCILSSCSFLMITILPSCSTMITMFHYLVTCFCNFYLFLFLSFL